MGRITDVQPRGLEGDLPLSLSPGDELVIDVEISSAEPAEVFHLAVALDTLDVVGAKAEGELREDAELLASERNRFRRKSTEQLSKIPGVADVSESRAPEEKAGPESSADPFAGAVGVTPITLVHDAVCAVTGEALAAGSEACMVLFTDPSRTLITGKDALPQASTPQQEKPDD